MQLMVGLGGWTSVQEAVAKGTNPPKQDFRAVTFVERVRQIARKSRAHEPLDHLEVKLLEFMTWCKLETRLDATYMPLPVHFNLTEDSAAFLVVENGVRKLRLAHLPLNPPAWDLTDL